MDGIELVGILKLGRAGKVITLKYRDRLSMDFRKALGTIDGCLVKITVTKVADVVKKNCGPKVQGVYFSRGGRGK